MKLLSVVIPCFNSQDYMRNSIDSLLPGGENVELLIIDDGSSDQTAEIADSYARKYKSIIKVIHQENKGHGGAINTGLQYATGIYFKVVDSDDWVDNQAYLHVLEKIRDFEEQETRLDMIVTNYVYERVGGKFKKAIRYPNVFSEGKILTWADINHFLKGQYLLMHSLIYRTQMLKDCGLELPEHTFYVDELFAFWPLVNVKKIFYINVDFYRYFIGREDQSVNESVMIKRIDQQIKINKLMIDKPNLNSINTANLRHYMFNFVEIITIVSTILLMRSGTIEDLEKKKELWRYIKDKDGKLYSKLRRGIMGMGVHLPGKIGRNLALTFYQISRKVVGFN